MVSFQSAPTREPTVCLFKTIKWLKNILENKSGLKCLLENNLPRDIHKKNNSQGLTSSMDFYGFGLTEEGLDSLKNLCNHFLNPSSCDKANIAINIFKTLYSANQSVPLTPVQLSYIIRVDPFVMQIQFAGIEAEINTNKSSGFEYTYFAMPLEPIGYGEQSSIFAIWIGFLKWTTVKDRQRRQTIKRLSLLRHIVHTIGHPMVREVIESDLIEQRQAAEANARRFAAAGIMARNMAHNLGSHTINALSQPTTWENKKKKADMELEFDTEVQKLFGYLRDRMDFIAQVVTSEPVWAVPQTLHDVIKRFKNQLLLRKYLVTFKDKCQLTNDNSCKLFIDFPHGKLGEQALCAIFENCLRNSFYHGNDGNKYRGRIHCRVVRVDEEYVKLELIDLGCQKTKNNTTDNTTLPKTLRDFILEKFTNSGSESRRHLGIKEMKMASAFLRMHKPDEAEIEKYPLHWLWVNWEKYIYPYSESNDFLTWSIYLRKPQIAILVGFEPEEKEGLLVYDSYEKLKEKINEKSYTHRFIVWKKQAFSHYIKDLNAKDSNAPNICLSIPIRQFVVVEKGNNNIDCDSSVPLIEINKLTDWLSVYKPEKFELQLQKCWNIHLAKKAQLEVHLQLFTGNEGSQHSDYPTELPNVSFGSTPDFIFSSKNTTGNIEKVIVVERHADKENGGYSCKDCWKEEPCKKHKALWKNVQVYMGYKHSGEVSMFDTAHTDPRLGARLIESGLIGIVIVDERIKFDTVKTYQLYRAGIIPVNSKHEELNEKFITCIYENILNCTKLGFQPGMFLLSIHLAIAKQIAVKNGLEKLMEDLQTKLKETFNIDIVTYIHTGRGGESSFSEINNIRYIELSNIINNIEPAAKPLLIDIFLANRKK